MGHKPVLVLFDVSDTPGIPYHRHLWYWHQSKNGAAGVGTNKLLGLCMEQGYDRAKHKMPAKRPGTTNSTVRFRVEVQPTYCFGCLGLTVQGSGFRIAYTV